MNYLILSKKVMLLSFYPWCLVASKNTRLHIRPLYSPCSAWGQSSRKDVLNFMPHWTHIYVNDKYAFFGRITSFRSGFFKMIYYIIHEC
jgi:hypothetical protein